MTDPDPHLTRAQRLVLGQLADGVPRHGSRSTGPAVVLSTVAAELWRRGLVTRKGASRTARPSNPGYTYTITPEGMAALGALPGFFVQEGWWHPNALSGRVHDHPDRPNGNWSEAMHRSCEPVYTRRATRTA